MARRDRLGKGLGALLGDYLEPQEGETTVRRLPVSSIVPNPFQPRREFAEEELEDLSSSIRENGLLQPIVVRPAGEGRPSCRRRPERSPRAPGRGSSGPPGRGCRRG